MKQIFIFGSSSTYGVGSTNGGWSGLLKKKLHNRMYGENGIGEKYEVFNFGKSGATIDMVQNSYKSQLDAYGRDGVNIALLNVGGNNALAINNPDNPDNYVSEPEEYKKEIHSLLLSMKKDFVHIFFVEGGYYDESKVSPKQSPFDNSCSYFSNERKQLFSNVTKGVCEELDIIYIPVRVSEQEWIEKYIYQDGLHSNDAGYKYIFNNIWSLIEPLV